jgi:hypothetical protein
MRSQIAASDLECTRSQRRSILFYNISGWSPGYITFTTCTSQSFMRVNDEKQKISYKIKIWSFHGTSHQSINMMIYQIEFHAYKTIRLTPCIQFAQTSESYRTALQLSIDIEIRSYRSIRTSRFLSKPCHPRPQIHGSDVGCFLSCIRSGHGGPGKG